MPENRKKKLFHSLREEYGNAPFLEEEIKKDPIEQFSIWFDEAVHAAVFEPNGMVLATVSPNFHPSTRTLLLKEFDERGFVFFTSFNSRKGDQLLVNPYASATFWWKEIYRQVHIEGKIERVRRKEAIHYFKQRPKGAQIASLASIQSEPLSSREELEASYLEVEKKYSGKEIPCPMRFGGYRLIPERMEFWQGRKNRLHDRIVYIHVDDLWISSRLSP